VEHRHADILVGQWLEHGCQSTFTICDIDPLWIEQTCPALFTAMKMHGSWHGHSDDTTSAGLDAYFGSEATWILSTPNSSRRTAPEPIDERFARRFLCEAHYGPLEALLIRRGYAAHDMDQKWNIDVHADDRGGTVVLSRSWTGLVVYHWPYTTNDNGITFRHAILNADRSMVAFGTPEQEAERLREAFEGCLLGRPASGRWKSILAKLPRRTIEAAWQREVQNLF
jgi:hypothetical protein